MIGRKSEITSRPDEQDPEALPQKSGLALWSTPTLKPSRCFRIPFLLPLPAAHQVEHPSWVSTIGTIGSSRELYMQDIAR
jgi:hypothetical protein